MVAAQCYYCAISVSLSSQFCPSCSHPLILRGYYRLVRVLGQGGFGVVYEAIDTRLNRRCAIKAVASLSRADEQQVGGEARLLGQYAARFPFIPDVYDIWSETSRTYMVMRYIDGPTLDQMLARPWPSGQVEDFLRTLLGYLGQLHAADIVHRDLKPQNIKYTSQGQYVLLDFGIAKQGGATLNIVKALSPDYAPAEQVRGVSTDARSDIYSLGATAYHLLTGQPPTSVIARLGNGAALIPPSDLVPDVPPVLERALLRMLELDPDARPPHVRAALQLLNSPPPTVRAAQVPKTDSQPRPTLQVRPPVTAPLSLPRRPLSPPVPRPQSVLSVPDPRAGWTFWLLWVMASGFSTIAGGLVTAGVGALLLQLTRPSTDLTFAGLILGAIFGSILGVAQWRVLRRHLRHAGWWVPATALGWATGLAGMAGIADDALWTPSAAGIAMLGALIGTIVGLAQWPLLRRRVPNAGIWIIVNAMSLAVALVLLNAAVPDAAGLLVAGAETAIAPFAISGAALVWLLRRPALALRVKGLER